MDLQIGLHVVGGTLDRLTAIFDVLAEPFDRFTGRKSKEGKEGKWQKTHVVAPNKCRLSAASVPRHVA